MMTMELQEDMKVYTSHWTKVEEIASERTLNCNLQTSKCYLKARHKEAQAYLQVLLQARPVSRGIRSPLKRSGGPINRFPRTENTGRTDPGGLNKSIACRVNRSAGDQNLQA